SAHSCRLGVQPAPPRPLPQSGEGPPAPPQGAMFRCSARCCEDGAASMQQVQRCIERCHAPLARAQAIVTAELERGCVASSTPAW
uniref:Protein FAM136A n=1 Tax=Otus sunia TaxID=257818 RepID=A0A8C8AFX6_9STRI